MISVLDLTYYVGRINKFGYMTDYVLMQVLERRVVYTL